MTVTAHGIRIEGDGEFTERTVEAVEMLSRLPEFDQIQPYVYVIRQAECSGMFAYYEEPTLDVGEITWRHSPEWYASVIAHDSFHSLLYWDEWHRRSGATPPDDAWTGAAAEKSCLQFQIKVLRKISDDEWSLQYLQRQIDTIEDAAAQDPVPYARRYW